MANDISLAIDLMSGDFGMEVSLPSIHHYIAENKKKKIHFLLVGDPDKYEALSKVTSQPSRASSVEFIPSETIVTMDEEPAKAVRKRKSSMRMAINLVKEGRADGCVSAGNTGALMMLSHLILKPMEGIERTAICAGFPSVNGRTWVLDLGANIISEARHLYQFSIMAGTLVSVMDSIANPTISLLNVGSEHHKGNALVQKADKLIGESKNNYLGFIEADEIFSEKSNIVVTDGFTGNSVLKGCEGLARFLVKETKSEANKNIYNKILAAMAMPILQKIKNRFDPSNYNGASFLGFLKTIVKSHGSTDIKGFKNAVAIAVNQIENNLPEKIRDSVHSVE